MGPTRISGRVIFKERACLPPNTHCLSAFVEHQGREHLIMYGDVKQVRLTSQDTMLTFRCTSLTSRRRSIICYEVNASNVYWPLNWSLSVRGRTSRLHLLLTISSVTETRCRDRSAGSTRTLVDVAYGKNIPLMCGLLWVHLY